jgi:hypothetical protein
LLLGLSAPAFATVETFTVDDRTVSDSSGRLASGTVECDPGHELVIAGSVVQLVQNQLALANYSVFMFCDGTVQTWTSTLFNSSGVELKPGRAVTNAFAVDFTDFTFATPINQKILVHPVH